MKAILKFKGPVLIGGKKAANNFIESIDYIPGSYIRAALAQYIYLNCHINNKNEKLFWVEYKNQEECEKCSLQNMCINFNNIKFSFFYPKGTKVASLSQMICKNNSSHGFFETLLGQYSCNICPQGNNRIEKYTGYIFEGRPYKKLEKKIITRTAIDNYTRVSKIHNLYTLVAIEKTCDEGNIFEGYINGIKKEDIEGINIMIGKYTSSGYGWANITIIEENETKYDKHEYINKIIEFSNKYKQINKITDNNIYLAIKFNADILFDIKLQNKYYSTDEYKNMFSEAINLPDIFNIEKLYTEVYDYRGFDTSSNGNPTRKPFKKIASKGTLMVLSSQKTIEEIYNNLVANDALGQETENGYGKYEVYFGGVNSD